MKKVIKFLDNHRFILVVIILILIIIIFVSFEIISFFNYNFNKIDCTSNIDDVYCYNRDTIIFKNPEEERKQFFALYKEQIDKLITNYNLPKYDFYTSYYYEVAALLDYEQTNENKVVYDFFKIYNDTYQILAFYKKNILWFDIFYHYKVN